MLDRKIIENELEFCLSRIDNGLKRYTYGYFPLDGCKHEYKSFYNGGWTGGFWTAMLWLAYELSGDKKYREAACIGCALCARMCPDCAIKVEK